MSPSRLIAVTLLAATLTACNGDAAEEGQATGQVLEGTISDEMVPLDEVRSEAPLAAPRGTGSGSTAASGDTAEADSVAEPDAEPVEEAPAEPATAEEE